MPMALNQGLSVLNYNGSGFVFYCYHPFLFNCEIKCMLSSKVINSKTYTAAILIAKISEIILYKAKPLLILNIVSLLLISPSVHLI